MLGHCPRLVRFGTCLLSFSSGLIHCSRRVRGGGLGHASRRESLLGHCPRLVRFGTCLLSFSSGLINCSTQVRLNLAAGRQRLLGLRTRPLGLGARLLQVCKHTIGLVAHVANLRLGELQRRLRRRRLLVRGRRLGRCRLQGRLGLGACVRIGLAA